MPRCVALLLLGIFLTAGTTLPGPDALLHHGTGATREQHRSHVEPAGGCASHADACTLGRTATGAGAALVRRPTLRLDHPIDPPRAARPGPSPIGTAAARLPRPRAPPLPVA